VQNGERLSLEQIRAFLEASEEIEFDAANRREPHQAVIGFGLETEGLLANARRKLEGKQLDAIVATRYFPKLKGRGPFGKDPVSGVILLDSALAGEWDVFASALRHVILPASILGYFSLAYVSRMTRSFMVAELRQEYVTTARVKGLSERRVVWRHALGNVMVPLITVVALAYANLLEGSVLTETVFAWPGLGQYITNSLLSADMNAVLGGTIVVGAVFIGLNLLSDLLYRVVDPRAR